MTSFHDRGRGFRAHRLEHLVFEAIDTNILPGLDDPALEGLRVAHIEITANLARIHLVLVRTENSGAAEAKLVTEALDRARPRISRELCEQMRIKRMPMLKLSLVTLPARSEGGCA